MVFIESRAFTRRLHQLAGENADAVLRLMQEELSAQPDRGSVVPGLSGIRKARAANPGKARLRVLLAEDNKINQQYAMVVLGKGGHQVTIAENGHQAVEAVRNADFDLVLMDIQMPELDGVEATRRIRKLPAPKNAVPIFAMNRKADIS